MRTTLVLDDRLFREAKRRAASRGVTLSQIVNEALRDALAGRPAEKPPPFKMVTFGGGGPLVHHEPEDFKRVLEEEDLESYGR